MEVLPSRAMAKNEGIKVVLKLTVILMGLPDRLRIF